MAQVRPYRGVDARARLAERRRRLLDAGLDLLGGQPDVDITVRGICKQAGLTARYFYESFTDKDELIAAVIDSVVADLAATTQAAVATAPFREQNRAGITNMVRFIAADVRIGRVLFSAQPSNAVLVRKRAELGGYFAMLSSQHIKTALRDGDDHRITATSHFVVGGVAQSISAWLAGDIDLTDEQLIDELTAIVDELSRG